MSKEPLKNTIPRLDKGELKRVLKVGDLFAIGYGDLGSSIYYALGITALYSLGMTPVSLTLAGLIFICTALTYAELTSSFHESGGTASFARHAFNDLVSFIAGWGLLLDYVVTIAISAFAVGPYLSYFFPILKLTPVLLSFAVSLIAILLILNILGIKRSTRTSLVLTTLVIITQTIIIVIGFFSFDLATIFEHMHVNVANVDWSPTWPEFWKGTAIAMVAYTGIESIAQLGAEARRPQKTVPRAVTITMVVLLLMYIGISMVALSAMTPKELGTTYVNDPIAGIAAFLPFGKGLLGPWIGLLAAVLLIVASNAGIIGSSRLAYNMGEYYQLPRFFHRLHAKYSTPYASLTFFAIVASLVVLWSRGKLTFLADLYNFGAMIAFFFAHLSLIVLRIKRPEMHRPFRIGLNIKFRKYSIPISAIIGCLATLAVWILVVITKPEGRYLGIGWMCFGVLMYVLYRRKERIKATGSVSISKIRIPKFQRLAINNILVPSRGGNLTDTMQVACELASLHNTKISVLHVIEIPHSIPLDSEMEGRVFESETVLRQAEAIGRELSVHLEKKSIRARSISEAIIDYAKEGKFDLIVLGSESTRKGVKKSLGAITEKVMKGAPCRVWICGSDLQKK